MIFAAVRVAQPQIPSSAGPAERQGIRSHGRVRGSGRSSPGSARATETTDATADAHDPDLIPPGDSEEFDRVVASFGETTGPDALVPVDFHAVDPSTPTAARCCPDPSTGVSRGGQVPRTSRASRSGPHLVHMTRYSRL